MSEVAHIEARHSGLGTDEALVDVRKLIENTAAISNMASKHVNPDVDMVAAAWAVGINVGDPSQFDWTKIHIPGTAQGFYVMPHQLADAYAMHLAEDSPMPCTILGNDVGLGKTVTALLLVLMSYYKWKRRKAAGAPVDAWPTIFFEPPNLVAQVFNEITSFFRQIFTVVVVQGHPSSHGSNSRLAKASQRGKEFRTLMQEWKLQKDDPKASQTRTLEARYPRGEHVGRMPVVQSANSGCEHPLKQTIIANLPLRVLSGLLIPVASISSRNLELLTCLRRTA